MQRNIKMYLFDILTAIDSIYDYLGEERDFEKFESNKLLRRAVERELEIIGEAMNRILKIEPEFPVTNAKRIIGLRNWVIHSYDGVDSKIIWGTIETRLPVLRKEIDKLLNHR